MSATPTLADLPVGATAEILAVEGPEAVALRLADLGFLPGTRVRTLRRAPLGDPRVYEVRGVRMCLRRREAAVVRVRLEAGEPSSLAASRSAAG